jgi:hypothetical protein
MRVTFAIAAALVVAALAIALGSVALSRSMTLRRRRSTPHASSSVFVEAFKKTQ